MYDTKIMRDRESRRVELATRWFLFGLRFLMMRASQTFESVMM